MPFTWAYIVHEKSLSDDTIISNIAIPFFIRYREVIEISENRDKKKNAIVSQVRNSMEMKLVFSAFGSEKEKSELLHKYIHYANEFAIYCDACRGYSTYTYLWLAALNAIMREWKTVMREWKTKSKIAIRLVWRYIVDENNRWTKYTFTGNYYLFVFIFLAEVLLNVRNANFGLKVLNFD